MKCEIIEIQNFNSGDSAGPTLVFDAGMGNWSLFFYPLVKELVGLAKVCLINRDGYQDRLPARTEHDAVSVAKQIGELLMAEGIEGPYILVGHSLGGLHMRMFQTLFPGRVAGLVLLDAAHPFLFEKLPDLQERIKEQIKQVSNLIILGKLGLLKFAKSKIPTFGLPPSLHEAYFKLTTGSSYYKTYKAEMDYLPKTLDQCKSLGSLNDLPLLVISSPYGLNAPLSKSQERDEFHNVQWFDLQKDLSKISSNAIFIKSKGDHFLHLTDTKNVGLAIKDFHQRITYKKND